MAAFNGSNTYAGAGAGDLFETATRHYFENGDNLLTGPDLAFPLFFGGYQLDHLLFPNPQGNLPPEPDYSGAFDKEDNTYEVVPPATEYNGEAGPAAAGDEQIDAGWSLDEDLLVEDIQRELAAPLEQCPNTAEAFPYGPAGEYFDDAAGGFLIGNTNPLMPTDNHLEDPEAQEQASPYNTGRKQVRAARPSRQPRASRSQIDALVGCATKESARSTLLDVSSNGVQPVHPSPLAPECPPAFSSVEAAKRRLDRTGPGIKHHAFQVPDDDFALVDDDKISSLSAQLFDNLTSEPPAAPGLIAEADRPKFNKVQADALNRVKKTLASEEARLDARARCTLLVDAALRLHARGIPLADLDREKTAKTGRPHASGFPVDVGSGFSSRVRKVLHIVASNKLVALDVLNGGGGAEALVRSPREYVHRKVLNFRGNDAKAKLVAGRGAGSAAPRTPGKVEGEDGETPCRGRKRGATAARMVELTTSEDDDSSPLLRKRRRTLPAPSVENPSQDLVFDLFGMPTADE